MAQLQFNFTGGKLRKLANVASTAVMKPKQLSTSSLCLHHHGKVPQEASPMQRQHHHLRYGKFIHTHHCCSSKHGKRMLASSSSSVNNDPPEESVQNHFQVLGIQPSFDLDMESVKSRYRFLMSLHHPDKQHGDANDQLKKEDVEQNFEADPSAITRAYDVMTHPHSRACHILELHGMNLDENDTGDLVGLPFLMQVMELREEVEEATSSPTSLQEQAKESTKRIQDTCQDLSEAFASERYQDAKKLTAQLRYWYRIDEEIREKL